MSKKENADDPPKGLKFTVRHGGQEPQEANKKNNVEISEEELDHAITHTKSGSRRKS